ncbi:hypothetical protein [Rahnella variigena]|uniref:hypothetical protein n=1 Tax=Rahnella variigena TaxID=574964 RepID=UPI00132FF226|nr:hypothetical protein [Rahnella variigena]
MFRKHLLVILVVSACVTPAIAEKNLQQTKVQNYCDKVSSIILQAGTDYNHQLSNAVQPENAKISVTQKVMDSEEYVNASSQVKTEIDVALKNSTDYVQFLKMMTEQDKIHERYVGMHGWTWAYHNTTPFISWCNCNRISG